MARLNKAHPLNDDGHHRNEAGHCCSYQRGGGRVRLQEEEHRRHARVLCVRGFDQDQRPSSYLWPLIHLGFAFYVCLQREKFPTFNTGGRISWHELVYNQCQAITEVNKQKFNAV